MKPSRGKVRIGAVAVLGAVAFAMLTCAGCFDTAASNPARIRVDPNASAINERNAAISAHKLAAEDAWKACASALDRSVRECERVCPIDLSLFLTRSLTTQQLIDLIPKKCAESHGARILGLDKGQSLGGPDAAQSRQPCDVVATEQFREYAEGPALDRDARSCERVCPIDLPLPEIRSLTTKELIDRISESCAEHKTSECASVWLHKGNSGLGIEAEDRLGALENLDPVCDAAIHVVRLKKKEIEEDNEGIRAVRSYDEDELRHPANTMCNPTGDGGFNCYSW
jgi:ferredoxin